MRTRDSDNSGQPGTCRRAGRLALLADLIGELLVTVGLVLALLVVYLLWGTSVVADRKAHAEAGKVRKQWAAHKDMPQGAVDTSGGVGFLHVPSMGNGAVLVMKGTSAHVLDDGVAGYYTSPVKAQLPMTGRPGNFTLAAHRDGHGARFHNIDKIEKGDPIVFETRDHWFVYKAYGILTQTSEYNTKVLSQVPEESGRTKPGHYITLTTCTPVYTSRHRYVVWGELIRVDEVDSRRTPPVELRGRRRALGNADVTNM